MREAIYYFIVSSTIKRLRTPNKKEMRSDMIIHVDRTRVAHGNIYSAVFDLLEEIKHAFADEDSILFHTRQLKKCYDKYLDAEVSSKHSFDSILHEVPKTVQSIGAILQNGIGKSTKEKELTKLHKIYIGGDLLQRGLTFPNLLVSYFTRFAKSGGNMDTTLQRHVGLDIAVNI